MGPTRPTVRSYCTFEPNRRYAAAPSQRSALFSSSFRSIDCSAVAATRGLERRRAPLLYCSSTNNYSAEAPTEETTRNGAEKPPRSLESFEKDSDTVAMPNNHKQQANRRVFVLSEPPASNADDSERSNDRFRTFE